MSTARLRIAVHDYAGHPFQVQLSRELARRGHEVCHLYCASFQTPHGDLTKGPRDPATFSVSPVALKGAVNKYNPLSRLRQDVEYGRLLRQAIADFAPDVVLSANTPLASQQILQRYCRRSRIRFVFWMQDVYAEAARRVLKRKLPFIGVLGAAVLEAQERRLLANSDAIVTITEDFFQQVPSSALGRAVAIPNWAPIADLPKRAKDNAWSRRFGLHEKFCFFYTGTLGFKHNPGLLKSLAVSMRSDPDVQVVVVSEGLGADWLSKQVDEMQLTNLKVIGYQPFEVMPDMLAAADVLVGVLEKEAGLFSVPSKVLTYLCSNRALLLSIPEANLAARTVSGSGAGLLVSPDDDEAFLREARRLRQDPDLCTRLGAAGRRYAEQHFEIAGIADRFMPLLAPTPGTH